MHPLLHRLTRRVCGALAVAAWGMGVVPAAHADGVSGQGTWETTLQGRDLDPSKAGFEAYYDTALDITWLADGSYAKTSNYAAANSFGRMTWDEALTWVATLSVNGVTGWRLPTMVDTGAAGCDLSYAGGTDCGYNVQTKDVSTGTVYNELAHLYYVTLGNKGYAAPGTGATPQRGWGLNNTGPFSNAQSDHYWSGLVYGPAPSATWLFDTYFGFQDYFVKNEEASVWAVRPGDVATALVPEPSTHVLMGLGLAAVLVVRGRCFARRSFGG
jgi:PEP-CTERM motif